MNRRQSRAARTVALIIVVGGATALHSQEANSADLSLGEVIAVLSGSFQEAETLVVQSQEQGGGSDKTIGGTRRKLIRSTSEVQGNLLNKADADGLCISSMVAKIDVRIGKNADGFKIGVRVPQTGEASVGFGEGETVAAATVEITCINPKCRADT